MGIKKNHNVKIVKGPHRGELGEVIRSEPRNGRTIYHVWLYGSTDDSDKTTPFSDDEVVSFAEVNA